MFDFIREAGWGIFPVLGFGLCTLAASLRFARGQSADLLRLSAALSFLTLSAGALGTFTGLQAAARYVEAHEVKWLFVVGLREALNNLVAALVLVMLAWLVIASVWLWPARPEPARPLASAR
jgi:hypothetical protein